MPRWDLRQQPRARRRRLILLLCLPWLAAAAPVQSPPAPAPPPQVSPTQVPGTLGPLIRPVLPGCVTSPFGPRFLPQAPVSGHYHWGADLRAAAGTQVRAVAAGQIIRIDRRGMGGLEILVQHDGFRALYAHLGMVAPRIANGARRLKAGEWIGRIGRTGLTLGTHLYFEIAIGGKRLDPAPYLGVTPCGAGKSAEERPIRR